MQLYDAGVAISGFSCFVTPDLARDLANDVMNLVSKLTVTIFFCTKIPLVSMKEGELFMIADNIAIAHSQITKFMFLKITQKGSH